MTRAQERSTVTRGSGAGLGWLAPTVTFCYVMLLGAIYESVVSPHFAYLSFYDLHPERSEIVVAAAICTCMSLLLPKGVDRPSDFAAILIFLLVYIPSILMTSYLSSSASESWAVRISCSIGMLTFLAARRTLWKWRPRPLNVSRRLPEHALAGIALISLLIVGARYGFAIKLHNLTDVYDQRAEFKDALAGASYIRFLVGILSNVVCPVLIARGIYKRSRQDVALGVLSALYVFGVTGLKTAFSSVFFVVLVYAGARYAQRKFFVGATLSLIVITLLGWVLSATAGFTLVADLVVRRVLLIQGVLTYNYFHLFEGAPSSWLSHSILSPLFQVPRVADPAGTVGAQLFGPGIHANANIFADGYVNGKTIGIILLAGIAGVFFSAVDTLSRQSPLVTNVASISMIAMMSVQTGIITAVGTHGGMAMLMILYLLACADSRFPEERLAPPKPSSPVRRSVDVRGSVSSE